MEKSLKAKGWGDRLTPTVMRVVESFSCRCKIFHPSHPIPSKASNVDTSRHYVSTIAHQALSVVVALVHMNGKRTQAKRNTCLWEIYVDNPNMKFFSRTFEIFLI
jgi:hypothetical protein